MGESAISADSSAKTRANRIWTYLQLGDKKMELSQMSQIGVIQVDR